jgi:hypothetical protein
MVTVTPLEFLEAVYVNEKLPLPTRMKAAIEAAPYVHPKLAMIGMAHANGDFGVQLERTIAASAKAQQEPKLIEAKATNGHLGPSSEDVSSKSMTKSFQPLRRRA